MSAYIYSYECGFLSTQPEFKGNISLRPNGIGNHVVLKTYVEPNLNTKKNIIIDSV